MKGRSALRKNKNIQKICFLTLTFFFLYLSVHSSSVKVNPISSSSNPLVFISYATMIDSILPALNLNKVDDNELLSTPAQPVTLLNSLIFSFFILYSYQRKNQVVLDKRKYIFKLFPYCIQGNIHKWRNRLAHIL